MDVSVIIVNYNTLKMTSECIDSVIDKTHDVTYEIILVDNGSTDGSKEYFEKDSRVKYIYSTENLGFGRANNLGAKHANGKYLFLLNSDTLLLENSIQVLFQFLQANENYSACGCQLIYADCSYQESHIKYPSLLNDVKEIIPSKLRTSKENKEVDRIYYLIDTIESINGADIFIRKDVFDKVGGFDEDYFMYFEETDLFFRIKELGYKIAVIPNTTIIHINGGSFSKISVSKYNMMYSGKLLFYKKHHTALYQICARLILSFSTILRINIFRSSIFKTLSTIWK